ncbi:glycosyltransferase family 9 protein [uncultured Desulfovibrio sp.]|uniref:glycosyltransferase family 9 protein n=1 Tax=uncultured Desulfovibrio sp. TaxID=167968 RepID=UPI0026178107|nr:glycosyltransferase family 9 protein [uncultured Desulfovibrio sp.]
MSTDVLLLNLTRFGDLLQCQPLIQDLHDSGHKVGLVCLDNFAAALPLLRHVQTAWPLPGAKLMAALDRDWRTAVAQLLGLTRRIRREDAPRHVVNLTPTLPARLLSKLLAPTPDAVLGFGLDSEGFGVNRGIWSSFLSGATLHRLNAPFNLVDMFRMVGAPLYAPDIAGRPGRFRLQSPPDAARAHAEALLARPENLPPGTQPKGFVALQLGASAARRQWPVAHFAALGERLWREAGLCPVLLGAPSERALAREYAAHNARSRTPLVSAVGRTDIPQLAALLRHMRLLVTNDTGTMHLAAGLGLPCLAFFLATAQPWDTGPYLPGCCCLEPAMDCHPCSFRQVCPREHACLTQISPASAGDLVLARLNAGNWQAGLSPELSRQARVWLTETDARGFAAVRSLSGHDAQDRSLWLGQQRLFWRHILDDLGDNANDQSAARANGSLEQRQDEKMRQPLNAPPPCSPDFCGQVAPVLAQAARLLDMLAEQGRLTGKSARAGQLFLLNCERLQTLLNACPPLASLACFWRELQQQRGDRMDELLCFVRLLAGHLEQWAAHMAASSRKPPQAGTRLA